MWHYYVYLMCDDDENDYKAYERMHGSHGYRNPEYEHRIGREKDMTMRLEAINTLTLDMIEKN